MLSIGTAVILQDKS